MFEAMKALAERSVMERAVLLLNHVISAEPQAMERLRAHAARTLRIELEDWPSLLPAPSPIVFRITAPGLVEWVESAGDLAPDLRVAIDAANPALAFASVRRRRAAAAPGRGRRRVRDRRRLADRQPALGRAGRPGAAGRRRAGARDRPLRQRGRQGDPRGREGARRLRPARRPPGRTPAPSRRPDEAPRPADLHLGHGLSLRSGRARAVELSPALGARPGARPHDRPHASTRRAASGCASGSRRSARSSSSSARCCRPGATCCRPTSPTSSPSCRTACRRSRTRWRARSVERAFGRPIDERLRQLRRRAGGQRLDRPGALRGAEGRPRGRGQGAAAGHAGGDRRRPRRCCASSRVWVERLFGRRQAAEAARGRRRVRQLPARRARPGARGGQRRAAAPQHGRASTCCSCPRWCGSCARRT